MNKYGTIIIVIVLILPWIGVLIYILTKKSRAKKYYSKLQEKYELTTEPGKGHFPLYSGYYRSRPVKIECDEHLRTKKLCTLLTVGCENPASFEFLLVKRKQPKKSVYTAGSYLIDDKEFDDKFIVHTNDIERLKKLFDFNTRFKLQQVSDLGFRGEIRLEGNSFSYNEQGLLKNDGSVMRLELVLHELCDLADVMKYN